MARRLRMIAIAAACAAALVAALVVSGGTSSPFDSGSGSAPNVGSTTRQAGGAAGAGNTGREAVRLGPSRRPPIADRPRTITTANGAVIGSGPLPRSFGVPPRPDGCVRRAGGEPSTVPPKPGLAAQLESDYEVTLTWTLPHDLPSRCRPDRLEATVDVFADIYGPYSQTFDVSGTRGIVLVKIPPALRRYLYQPEVATAAMYARHSGGLTSVVRIARAR